MSTPGLTLPSAAAQADLIVSGDKDLLDLHEHQGIPIITAANALPRVEAAQS